MSYTWPDREATDAADIWAEHQYVCSVCTNHRRCATGTRLEKESTRQAQVRGHNDGN